MFTNLVPSRTITSLLAVLVLTVALATLVIGAIAYYPSRQGGSSTTPYPNSSSESQESTTENSSTIGQSSTVMGTTTLFYLNPSNCKVTCTFDIPWPTYESLAALRAASVYVGVATVTSSSTINVDGVAVTRYNITIVQNIIQSKYATPGSTWSVAQIGGTSNGPTMSVEGYPTLAVGGTYVFFLNYFPLNYSLGSLGKYYGLDLMTVGGPQGLFCLQAGKVYSLDDMYAQDDAWLPVKAAGVPLAQFIQEVQSATSTSTTT